MIITMHKNLRDGSIPSRDIDDQRILQSAWRETQMAKPNPSGSLRY